MSEQLQHTLNCPARTPSEADNCHCGLKYRIEAQDYLTLLTAWQKRCTESESELSASQAREAELREKLEKVQGQIASWKLLVDQNQQLAIDAIKRAETAERECDNWIDSAKHFSKGMEYYSGLIDECAKHIGLPMYVADDSGVSPEPLRAKIVECVGELVQRAEAAEARKLLEESKVPEDVLFRVVEVAHMAGQRNQGCCDPSAYEALVYWNVYKLQILDLLGIKPQPKEPKQ